MRITRGLLAAALLATCLAGLPAQAHCVKRNGVVIDPSFVVPGTLAGGGVDVGHLACPVTNTSIHIIPPGPNALVAVMIFDEIILGSPATGTLTIKGFGADQVVTLGGGVFDGPDGNGVYRIRSFPVYISPLKKGTATATMIHGSHTYTAKYSRTLGT